MKREKLTYAQKNCVGSTGKLMQQTGMLAPGARVGVAVSGGEDSFTLLKVMLLRKRVLPFHIDVMALHVNPGFDDASHAPLFAWAQENGVATHIEVSDHGPRAHSDENKKNSACFYCCRLRRSRLFHLMNDYNLTHLALGHNADDLAATFFLNLFQAGRVDGMAIKQSFFQGKFELIRPMLWLPKDTISKACRQWGLPIWKNACPSAEESKRSEFMRWLDEQSRSDKRIKQNVLSALRRRELDLTMKSAYKQ